MGETLEASKHMVPSKRPPRIKRQLTENKEEQEGVPAGTPDVWHGNAPGDLVQATSAIRTSFC